VVLNLDWSQLWTQPIDQHIFELLTLFLLVNYMCTLGTDMGT
jgi:hypothetical protein